MWPSHSNLGLVCDGFLSSLKLFLIEQVIVFEGLHVLVKLEDKWACCRDIVCQNFFLAHSCKVLDDGPERVAVGNNNDTLALDNLRANSVVPVG